jgi:microcystin-dependent protein
MNRDYAGGAATAALTGGFSDVTSNPLSISCDDLTGWPLGAADGSKPFFVSVGRGTATEEKILVTQRVGNTLIVNTSLSGQRGADSTTARSHASGETIEHVITATDAEEANEHVNASQAVHGLPAGHDVVGRQTTQTLTGKTMSGASNTFSNIPQAAVTGLTSDLANRYTEAETDAKLVIASPVGSVTMFGGATAPSGWLKCDGAAVSRTTYASLFAVLGTTYGAGNGSTTFNVPNLTNKVPRGGTPGSTGGADSVTLGSTNLPQHLHDISHDHASFNTASGGTHGHEAAFTEMEGSPVASGADMAIDLGANSGRATGTIQGTAGTGAHAHSVDVPAFTGSSGLTGMASPTPIDTLPAFLGLTFIIRAA